MTYSVVGKLDSVHAGTAGNEDKECRCDKLGQSWNENISNVILLEEPPVA
jgi:hypothetical protein